MFYMRELQLDLQNFSTISTNTVLSAKSKSPSGLYIVSTPIGNLQDITFRAIETLKSVDLIYCEDKRQSTILLNHYNIKTPLSAYHEHNADKIRPEVLEKIRLGGAIALISDAGTPLISDPGYKLVAQCHDEGFLVCTIPGPSAVIAALSVSGLPSDHFYFGGFLPPKESERRRCLEAMRSFPHTMIYFEAPRRLLDTLRDIGACLGNRQVCVARELTKTFEEVRRSTTEEMIDYYQNQGVLKGEIVLLIRGENAEPILTEQVEKVLAALMDHYSTKEASSLLADLTGLSKKLLYSRALEFKRDDD